MCAFLHLRDTVGKGQHSTAPQFQNLGKQKHFCTSYCHVCLLWGHSALRNPGMWPCIPIAQTDLVAKWTSLPLISTSFLLSTKGALLKDRHPPDCA